ncbi:hypothetical protein SUDANB52_04001 [Streptomyces sp. SudanB52_2052]
MNRFSLCVSRGIARVTEAALGPYQTAVIRIGFSATWLLFLLRELPTVMSSTAPTARGAGPWPSS